MGASSSGAGNEKGTAFFGAVSADPSISSRQEVNTVGGGGLAGCYFSILGTLSSAKVMVDPTRQIAVGGGGRAGGDFSIIGILSSAKVMVLRRQ